MKVTLKTCWEARWYNCLGEQFGSSSETPAQERLAMVYKETPSGRFTEALFVTVPIGNHLNGHQKVNRQLLCGTSQKETLDSKENE